MRGMRISNEKKKKTIYPLYQNQLTLTQRFI